MNKKLIAVAVSAVMLAPLASYAADATLYGSIRAGIISSDDDRADSSNELDLGGTGKDGNVGNQGLYSRIGIKGSADLGNGASAGFKVERGVGDTLSVRHTNVWIGGGWGKLTFGQQDNPYRGAAHWDQTWYMGNQFASSINNDGGSRIEGLRYDLSSGPFGLSIMATANDSTSDQDLDSETTAARPAGTGADAVTTTEVAGIEYDDGVDSWIVAASYDFGVVNLNVAHRIDNKDIEVAPVAASATAIGTPATALDGAMLTNIQAVDKAGRTTDNTAIGVNGTFGPVSWYVAYQMVDDNVDGDSFVENDVDSIGGFVSFSASDNDTLYLYHVSHDADRESYDSSGALARGTDLTETVFGYSHSFGGGVTFIGEYLTIDKDLPGDGSDPNTLALTLKVDF